MNRNTDTYLTRPARRASIRHNTDDTRRVHFRLERISGGGFRWFSSFDGETDSDVFEGARFETIESAERALVDAYGNDTWDLRGRWVGRLWNRTAPKGGN